MAIGVQQRFLVRHDADMTVPEHQVAALEAIEIIDQQPVAKRRLLHVAVTQRLHSASLERQLHEAGAVEAVDRLAAPEIGNVTEHFGDRHEVGFHVINGLQMCGEHKASIGKL